MRRTIGAALESTIGRERVRAIRRVERRTRTALATRIAMDSPTNPPLQKSPTTKSTPKPKQAAPVSRWQPPERLANYPKPNMSRHELLTRLHEILRPRTYLEIGVFRGESLALSRTRSVGIDPAFVIENPINCDLQLIKITSDAFFAQEDPVGHFQGVPIDLAFIDGMHLSEFALRDFMNLEPLMADTGVVVFDDILPRNALEASRDRKTGGWTGDVYKVAEILLRRRPDLVVLLVNTRPTGTALVLGLDGASKVLDEAYPLEEEYLLQPDPQTPAQDYLERTIAVEPDILLASPVWEQLVLQRGTKSSVALTSVWEEFRRLQQGPASSALREPRRPR